jgi:hypothetical protein
MEQQKSNRDVPMDLLCRCYAGGYAMANWECRIGDLMADVFRGGGGHGGSGKTYDYDAEGKDADSQFHK